MYHQALHTGNGKKVIIIERGWPSKVESFKDSPPSEENTFTILNFLKSFLQDENLYYKYHS